MNQPALNRQEPRRLRTRAALLLAGAELLADRSIDAVAINEIVEHAGVAKGSFFNHFSDKDDFADAIAFGIRQAVEVRVDAANEGIADPAMRVARGIRSFVAFALIEPRDARVMLRGANRAAHADHPLNRGLRTDLAAGTAAGQFRIPSIDASVLYVIGVCQALLAAVVERDLDHGAAERLTREMVVMLLGGLGMGADNAESIASQSAATLAP